MRVYRHGFMAVSSHGIWLSYSGTGLAQDYNKLEIKKSFDNFSIIAFKL